jgi:hypothetical protein
MTTLRLLLPLSLVLLSGCSLFMPKETLYLKSAQGHATQAEVQQHLGQPAVKAANQSGEAVWVYEVLEEQPGNRWTATGMWCDEYVLTFDEQKILRGWTHKSQFHGGELQPTYCVWEGYRRS